MLHLLGKLLQFSVLGALTLALIGPVMGIIGALAPFAIVGGLVWGGYRGLKMVVARWRRGGMTEATPVVAPMEIKPIPLPVLERIPDDVPSQPSRWRRAGRMLQEMVCGALIAGGVAAAFCWQAPGMAETVGAAVLAGTIVGFVVGRSLPDVSKPMASECVGEACGG